MKFRQRFILKSGLRKFFLVLVCFMMVFLLNMAAGVVYAAGEINLKLSKIEDVKGWLDCELAGLDDVNAINIELCDDIYIGYDVLGLDNGACGMDPGGDYIFNFTDSRFKGMTININGHGKKITDCKRDLLFLRASDCVVNLNDVRVSSRHTSGRAFRRAKIGFEFKWKQQHRRILFLDQRGSHIC